MKLSQSAKIIIEFLSKSPKSKYHVNEIIRRTKIFPRSATLSLKRLQFYNLIKIKNIGNLKLISINLNHVKRINYTRQKTDLLTKHLPWVKILTRKTDICFQ